MQLKLKRSQKTSGMLSKSVVFCLDARLDLDYEEVANVKKYGLGGQVVYSSATSRKYLESAANAMAKESGGLMGYIASSTMARLSLNITIDSLTKGRHVECKDLDELLGAESAITNAAQATLTYLDIVETFDGREIIIDITAPDAVAA